MHETWPIQTPDALYRIHMKASNLSEFEDWIHSSLNPRSVHRANRWKLGGNWGKIQGVKFEFKYRFNWQLATPYYILTFTNIYKEFSIPIQILNL